MAEQPPLTLVGEVLLKLVHEGIAQLRPTARQVLEHLRQVSVPPAGVSFRSDDGAAYTGLVLLDGNKVVMMFAARTEGAALIRTTPAERPPLITPPPAPQRPSYSSSSQRSFYDRRDPDEEEPDWDRDEPYGRFK